jgi:integrase
MNVTVRVGKFGFLALRFYNLGEVKEVQVGTELRDTPENRRRLEAHALVMRDEMAAGTFDFAKRFPNHPFALRARRAVTRMTVGAFAQDVWLPQQQPPQVRRSRRLDYLKHLRAHILPEFGDTPFHEVTLPALRRFKTLLTAPKTGTTKLKAGEPRGKGLSIKTARNIIDGTFRALYRDARGDGYCSSDPFAEIAWPRLPPQRTDPFTEEERDLILNYFQEHPVLHHYYPWVYTAFWTGMRPSELAGLRRGDVDLRSGQAVISVSRTLHEDNATKTPASTRVIVLDECVVAVLQEAARPHPSETAYVFTNTEARPMHTPSFTKNHWRRVLDELRIRPRKFYATRHTFISISLSNGINAKFIAEYCGTSLAMIEKHYGRYIRSDAREQLALNRRRAQRIPHSEAQSPGSGRVRSDTSRQSDETDCQ